MRPALISRRLFLAGGVCLSGAANPPKNETVYDFATADCQVRMNVAFYDRYSSSGFWFRDDLAGRRFCLSATGDEGRNCSESCNCENLQNLLGEVHAPVILDAR
jgi:hypothetical protein